MSPLEIGAALLSAWGVWLTARRRLTGFPVSLLACGLYAKVFLDARLYSDAILQILFAGFVVYGWFRWRRHLDASHQVIIAPLPRARAWRQLAFGAAGGLLLGTWMHGHTDAALPWLDAALTCFSLVAQYWQARRHLASWWLWTAIDLLYVGEYASKSLWITALLYAGFVGLAIHGWRQWRQASSIPPLPLQADS